jgi:cell division protein FtsN
MADHHEERPETVGSDAVAGDAAKKGDPLAELARLIGQNDPFANFGRANPTHPLRQSVRPKTEDENGRNPEADPYFDNEIFDEAQPQPAWVQHRQEQAIEPDPDIASRPHPLHRFATTPAQDAEPPVQDQAAYADPYPEPPPFDQAGYRDEPYAYGDDFGGSGDNAKERSRRGIVVVAAVLGLAIVGTGGAFAYRTFVASPRTGDVPVIKADNNPIKVVPPTAGDNKAIQDRLTPSGGEKMVSREEQPVDVRDPTKAGAKVNSSPFPPVSPQRGTSSAGAPSGALGDEPRRVRTLTVKGDSLDINPAQKGQKQPAAAARPAQNSPQPAPATPGPSGSVSAAAPLSLRPNAAPAAAAPTSGYVVQVSSQRSESDAQASYRALQGKFPSVLGSRQALIKRADLGDKGTYYRAVLGPFNSAEDAARLCGDLKSAGGQCVVQRN